MKIFFALLCCLLPILAKAQAPVSPTPPQIVVLKLDDVTANGAHGKDPVSPRWLRVTEFIEKNGLHASFGIIGHSLEGENGPYFDWIKAVHTRGHIEFWNHGYHNKRSDQEPREFEQSLEEQRTALQKTQALARAKLGFDLRVFGPHWSGANADTEVALDTCPEIVAWFGLVPNAKSPNPKRFVFERVLALENPTFVPDFEKFRTVYEQRARQKPVLALQGHPNQWNEERWAGFVKIIDYLKAQGCVFLTPSEYLANIQSSQP